MSNSNHHLDQQFSEFLSGRSTEPKRIQFWRWLFLLDARPASAQLSEEEETQIGESMRQSLLATVHRRKATIRTLRITTAVAAGLFIAAATSIFFLSSDQRQPANSSPLAITNTGNKVKSFYLPDSSFVVLNRFSSIEMEAFNQAQRRVRLTGEAYFNVHPDAKRPFTVVTGSIATRALGTAFSIEAYANESEMRVSLLEGLAEVSDTEQATQAALLHPGQLVRYHHQRKALEVERIDVVNPLAWTKDGMTFNRIPLTEALNRVSRHYGVSIRCDSATLQGKIVSGSFTATTWEKLLPNILFVHNLKYQIKDSTINIYK